jgi:hypothetical protein
MRSVLLLVAVVPVACVVASDPVTVDPPRGDPPAPKLVLPRGGEPPPAVQMSWCEQAGCTLTFTFAAPMPDAKLVFEPRQAGTSTWTSPTELVFAPAKGAMLAGHAIAVSIPEAGFAQQMTVPFFEAAGKVARWPVEPGRPRFVALLTGFVAQIGRGPLFALYDQPVEPDAIATHTRVRSGGKRIGAKIRRPSSTAQIYDRAIELANLVTIELDKLPADGEQVSLELPSRDDAGEPTPEALQLQVNTTLTAGGFAEATDDGTQKGHRAPLAAEFTVALSNQVTASAFAAHVAIEPKPVDVHTHVWGEKGVVRATLEPGVLYRLTVDNGLHDVLGNKLRAPVVASFRARDAAPKLTLPNGGLVLEAGHARLPIQMTNAGELKLVTHRFATARDWLAARTAETACEGDAIDVEVSSPLNQQVVRDVALEPGLYCVAVTATGRGSAATARPDADDGDGGGAPTTAHKLAAQTYVQVSRLGLTAKVYDGHVFAWLTRLSDGKPIGDARISLVDEAGLTLGSATTDPDGTATLDKVAIAGRAGLTAKASLIVNDGELVAQFADDALSHARQFGLDGKVRDTEPLAGSLFTERGVYRPGETAHVKLLVRDPDSHKAARGEVAFAIDDPRGEKVVAEAVKLDAFGGATLDVPLKGDAKVGAYTVHATQDERTLVRGFQVEEYRVPAFAVAVATDEVWQIGQAAHAAVTARYLHGSPLAGREVSYDVTRAPEPFAPASFPGFVFDAAMTRPRASESLTHGSAKLDGQGHFVIGVKPDHGAQAGPMRYTVDASVTDVDRQVYAGKLSRVIHAADFYVGMAAPARRIATAGDTLAIPVVAVTPDGAARAGASVTVSLERIDYHGVTRLEREGAQRITRPVATTVARCEVTTRATAVDCRLAVAAAGDYVVRATAEDRGHRRVEAAFAVLASGGTPVAWPRFDHERIQLVADRASYRPGEVARLVVQSPFPEARGLLTIERDGVIEHRVFAITGDTPELRVPITGAHVPNVFVSVVLVRGRIHDAHDATGFETGAPAFRLGYAQLHVEPIAHHLDVTVTPASPKAYPGTTLAVDLAVKDRDGKPRAGQATVMVVDEAVLGMTGYRTPDPLADVFAARPLAVRTGETRLDMLNARRSRREQVFPAGDGGEAGTPEPGPAALEELPSDLRRLFQSTAFYQADVPVDDHGLAHVSVTLPDNVTTYRIMAVVVDDDTRVGAGHASLLARKPVIVSPALPRFVHPGDRLQLEARVFNGTDTPGRVEIASDFRGVTLAGDHASQASQAPGGGEARFVFPVTVADDARGEATVRFTATLAGYRDAIEVKLPIVDPGTTRKLVVSKVVAGTDQLVVPLPPDRRPGTVKVEIVASTTALSELKDAVEYLMTYPNGCIEQTTATAYPLVMLHDLLPAMGVTVDEAQLKRYAEAGVKRILSFQTTSGGLSYWPGKDEPHAFATAFGLTALIEAKAKGYDVPDAALARMADFLESSLRQGTITGEMPHRGMADADTRAFFVMTLGRLGRPQPAYVSTLWDKRDKLTPFGLAFLAVAVTEGTGDKALLQPMLDAVRQAAKEEKLSAWYEGNPKLGWSFDSPLRTHAGALLAYADARADGAMSEKLLAGLLARRTNGMWGNTQEDVFGIMAVAKLTGAAGTDKPDVTVKVDGKAIDAGLVHDVAGSGKRVELSGPDVGKGDQLVVEFANGGKPVHATVRVEYVAELDAHNRAPRSAGFAMTRRYETIDGASLEGKHLKLGSLVRARLHVHADQGNHYVAIDDKLPAGLEPLNAALATTETVAAGKVTPQMRRALAVLSYSELRDSRVAFFIDDMAAGDYELTYVARATTPGAFVRPAASVEAMYQPEIAGASATDDITIE